jgi:hypothetical protein
MLSSLLAADPAAAPPAQAAPAAAQLLKATLAKSHLDGAAAEVPSSEGLIPAYRQEQPAPAPERPAPPRTKLLALCPTVPPAMQREGWCMSDYVVMEKLYKGYASKGGPFLGGRRRVLVFCVHARPMPQGRAPCPRVSIRAPPPCYPLTPVLPPNPLPPPRSLQGRLQAQPRGGGAQVLPAVRHLRALPAPDLQVGGRGRVGEQMGARGEAGMSCCTSAGGLPRWAFGRRLFSSPSPRPPPSPRCAPR